MIKPVKGGYIVKSKSGKTISKTYPTREQAQQRLREIEYWKNKKGK